MKLTERDKEILRQVYALRLMTREQIERLIFPPTQGRERFTRTSLARHRLKLLFQNGYMERIPVPIKPGAWVWKPLYRLGRVGAQVLAEERGMQVAQLPYWGRGFDKDRRMTDVSWLFAEHQLKINDVRIALTLAARRHGYTVEKWIDDGELKSQEQKDYVTVRRERAESLRVAVVPDGYIVLNLGNRRAHFFLELDQATMSNPRWKIRIQAYQAYIASQKYQARYQTRSLRILTITTTSRRLDNLKHATEQVDGGRLFWFTTFDQLTPESILLSPIWRVAGEEGCQPLIS